MAAIRKLEPEPGNSWQDQAAGAQLYPFRLSVHIDGFDAAVAANTNRGHAPVGPQLITPVPQAQPGPGQYQQHEGSARQRRPEQQHEARKVQYRGKNEQQ